MSWFGVKLQFVSRVGGRIDADAIVEESIRVLRATDEADALRRATELGHASSHAYENADGELVEWVFTRTLEVQDLSEDAIEEGTEVFSTLRRAQPNDLGGSSTD